MIQQQDIPVKVLVDKIKRGEIRLPDLQRKYVWSKSQVRDLLDSLYRGYPSGTILTWETDEEVAKQNFAIKQEIPERQTFQFLLDGQQRLTSLRAILNGEEVYVKEQKKPIDILFNLDHPDDIEEITDTDPDKDITDASNEEALRLSNRMTFFVSSKKLIDQPNWVSVTKVFKERSDTPFLEKAGITEMKDPRFTKYTTRLKKLRDIEDYMYRVYVLGRDKSYEEVTDIFVRVNSKGTELRSSDLALAQIAAKWRNSVQIFEEFERKCNREFKFKIKLAIHLKNLVSFATEQSKFNIVGSLSKEKMEVAWKDAVKGMEFALNFLEHTVKIDSAALLSSPFIMIVLAKYGHLMGYNIKDEKERERLRYWVLVANAKGRYSRGATESLLNQDLSILHREKSVGGLLQLLKRQFGELEISPSELENKDSRSAYFKTMFMAFRDAGAEDWNDAIAVSEKPTKSRHAIQGHHIFPRALLKKRNLHDQKINDICNLAFISAHANKSIGKKEPSTYLPDIISNELSKQCIPDDPSLWKLEAYEDFLIKRRELVVERLNQFLSCEKYRMKR